MATLTIRNVPGAEKEAPGVRAAKNGRSMRAARRAIIQEAVGPDMAADEEGLATAIRARFAPSGGAHPPERPPVTPRKPPGFE